jgi:hypothetical protein
MKKFLFVTCLTPAHILTPVRIELFNLYIESLKKQTYPHWKALLLGDESNEKDNFIYLKCNSVTKEDKLLEAVDYIEKMPESPDYIIRLDDDDLISPVVLSKISQLDFDCYSDKFHVLYNLMDGKICFNKLPWMPSTVVMKYESALTTIDWFEGKPLFCCDHDQVYREFFSDKKVIYSAKYQPLYLRILSPTSLALKNISEKKATVYSKFVSDFGFWDYFKVNDFNIFYPSLCEIANKCFNLTIIRGRNPITITFNKLHYKLSVFSGRFFRLLDKMIKKKNAV